MLEVKGLTGGYDNKAVLDSVSFDVHKGELFGILGPNGSGKTTLLSMLSGVLDYKGGSIRIRGRDLKDYSSKKLAQVIAVLPQHSSLAFSYTVKETVSLGRYAHQSGWFHSWSEEDETIVQRVMEQTGVADFQDLHFERLSGGERQRVLLAQALYLMRKMAKEQKLTVISIFHDLNLAGLYCDRLMLLEKGQIQVVDVPNEVLQQERIQGVYHTTIEKHPHPALPKPQMFIVPEKHGQDTIPLEIDDSYLTVGPEMIQLDSPIMLRTMSSGVTGSGTGWHKYFVNRHVHHGYDCEDHHVEMADYLKAHGFEPQETVGMMTAVFLDTVAFKLLRAEDFSVFIIVTAGVGNAIDASLADRHSWSSAPGTINTWIFVNGHLAEEAFIHSIVTATEAKVKALHDLHVLDKVTNTCATGTSTDSILIAATQRGAKLQYAGTITPLGKLISRGVYDCTVEALKNNRKRIEDL